MQTPKILTLSILIQVFVPGWMFGLQVWAVEPNKQVKEPLTFERHVRPILKAHCFHCHGEAGVVEGGLDVRLRRWLVEGGESGEAIVAGKPTESLLLERIKSGEMPPGETAVSPDEIAMINSWLQAGAETARPEPETLDGGDYITEEERRYWAFQTIRRPVVPSLDATRSVSGRSFEVETPIDSFLLAELVKNELGFSKKASRSTLVRRLTFDLWGLPPSREMVEQFVSDQHPHAVDRLIDRLLAAPEYGERWGRHWLDVAGYADSDGYTSRDVEREFAYFYRDYVIDSLNADKPMDQFLWEQLAGDEMTSDHQAGSDLTEQRIAQLAATGFLRMAPDGTSSGGVDRAEAANQNIADTVQIVSSTFLGLTVGCARCHDHRYDPISQADYYRMRAIFEPSLDWKNWKTPTQRRISLYTQANRDERATIEKEAKQAEADRSEKQQAHIERTLYEELLVVPDDLRDSLRKAYHTEKKVRTPEQVALLEEYPSVGNITNGSLYLYAQQRARRAGDIERIAKEKEKRYLDQLVKGQIAALPESDQKIFHDLVSIEKESWTDQQKQVAEQYPNVLVQPDQLEKLAPEAFAELQEYKEAAKVCRETDAKTLLAKLQDGINAIRAKAPKERFVRVLQEPENHQPVTHLFIRGDHQQPSDPMLPSELTVLKPEDRFQIPENDPSLPSSGRRLAYAKNLTNAEHPLVARVLVNRLWMHHFGRGIVSTPGDFGSLGAKPSHPELLDWLASELLSSGWSMKRLHRLIVSSHAYQQDSLRDEVADGIDPDNLLYSRMSVRRLESEAFRDAMLAASGELVQELHGPPVPVKEDVVGQIVIGKEMLDGERKPTGTPENYKGALRRSLYIQVRRSRPLAVLETFDVATVAPNCELRNASNVATQSLMMMNSQFVLDRAGYLAKRIIEKNTNQENWIREAWGQCFSEPIDDVTDRTLLQFLKEQTERFAQMDEKRSAADNSLLALSSACQAMLSSNAFLYVD